MVFIYIKSKTFKIKYSASKLYKTTYYVKKPSPSILNTKDLRKYYL